MGFFVIIFDEGRPGLSGHNVGCGFPKGKKENRVSPVSTTCVAPLMFNVQQATAAHFDDESECSLFFPSTPIDGVPFFPQGQVSGPADRSGRWQATESVSERRKRSTFQNAMSPSKEVGC
jgi:hypothetical protein